MINLMMYIIQHYNNRDIEIGDNVKIGANTVVTKSVSSNETVIEYNKVL